MKALPAALILALAAFCLSAHGNDEHTLTILYSSSLNGNLDGCDCKGSPRGGLVKRAAWLRTLDKPEQGLLVDGGDLLDPYPDRELATSIFDTYLELGYAAIALGDQEFANGVESLLEYRERYPLMAHNLTICPDDNRCIFFSTTPQILERAGFRVGVFALIDPQVFTLYPPELKNQIKIQDPKTSARNQLAYLSEKGVELTVLLYHGPYQSARELAETVPGVDVLILAHEQRLIEPRRIGDTILTSPGEDGNRLGILTVKILPGGRIEYNSSFRLFSWHDDPDDPAVRRRIDEYKTKLRQRL
jgi:2',3'-cyclic-nucleotide 2'-phosphodiesterase (5'-nucleotidase family)